MGSFTDRRAYHQPAPSPSSRGYAHGLRFDVASDSAYLGSLDSPEFLPAGSMRFRDGSELFGQSVVVRDWLQ